MAPRIAVISFSDLARDPRVSRQLTFLKEIDASITTIGNAPSSDPALPHVNTATPPRPFHEKAMVALKLLCRRFEAVYWEHPRIANMAKEQQFDVAIANDIDALPLACRLGKKVYFDAHEYAPLEFEDRFVWRTLWQPYREYLCRTWIPQANAMTTVCEGIAAEYARRFGVKVDVVTNAPFRQPLAPRPTGMPIRMIYHGAATPSRRVELALDVMEKLDSRFTLDMILIPGDSRYIAAIQKKAAANPRIRFIPAVPLDQICSLCNQYDIGFFPLIPTNFNYRFALPNKFFEFIQARVAVAITPLQEMAREVNRYGCGIVSPDFTAESIAKQLHTLTPAGIDSMKQQADRAAYELSAEHNRACFLQKINTLLTV